MTTSGERRVFRLVEAAAVAILLWVAALQSLADAARSAGGLDAGAASASLAAQPRDGGTSLVDVWEPTGGPSVAGGRVDALAAHPTRSGVAFASVSPKTAVRTGPSTIYRTTTGGASWEAVLTAERQVYALAAAADLVIAGAHNLSGEGPGLFVSRDGGDSWEGALTMYARGAWPALAIDPSNSSVAVAGGMRLEGPARGALLYRTTDAGRSWQPMHVHTFPDGSGSVGALGYHPLTRTAIAAIHSDNRPGTLIFRSDDGGATWEEVAELPNVHVMSLVPHKLDEGTFYVGSGRSTFTWGQASVFMSEDTGSTWTEVLPESGGRLAFEAPSTVYALEGQRLRRSASGGAAGTWQDAGELEDEAVSFALDDVSTPSSLFAGGLASGLSASTNGGDTWRKVNSGVHSGVAVSDVALSASGTASLLAATLDGGGWSSFDGGETWQPTTGAADSMASFAYARADETLAYGGAQSCTGASIFRSRSGGVSFEPVYTAPFITPDCSGGRQVVNAIAASPSTPGLVLAGGESVPEHTEGHGVLLRSSDWGDAWTEVLTLASGSAFEAVAFAEDENHSAYVGGKQCAAGICRGILYRSRDGSSEWSQLDIEASAVRSIVVDPQKPQVLYVSTEDHTIWKSTDGGDWWFEATAATGGPPQGDILAIDPRAPSHLYLAGPGYFGESFDGGSTWSGPSSTLTSGLTHFPPLSLAVRNEGANETIYGGYAGVWRYQRISTPTGEPMTVTVQLSRLRTHVGGNVTVSALAVDEQENWVPDGTLLAFAGGPKVAFGEDPMVVGTTDGRADAVLTALARGTATITVTTGDISGTAKLAIGEERVYMPFLEKR